MTIAAEASTGVRAPSATSMGKHERRAAMASALFVAPCAIIILVAVALPCLWLFWLSAFGSDGTVGGENYARVLTGESFLRSFQVTFEVSFATVLACIIIGVPFTLMIIALPRRSGRLLLLAVLLPFWTSLLVRAYAWIVLLQRNGVVNQALQGLGLTSDPLPLVFNYFGAILGMTHIMLPLFILPVLGSMRQIDINLMRASASLGATRWQALRMIFIPLSLPGIVAGSALVFVSCLGFYVTPDILGGGKVYMVAMRLERSLASSANWGTASALGVVLLLCVGVMMFAGLTLSRMLQRKS
ncbi:ABC transporter permease [Mesorhizobium sp. B2-4-15]|nr:ABC transporter permease [Mesorhizobium sp. B2-4-15]